MRESTRTQQEDRYGEHVPSPKNPNRRIFRARGRFSLYAQRPNIAKATFYFGGYTNPEDVRGAEVNVNRTWENLEAGDVAEMTPLKMFDPVVPVLIKRITISVTGLPMDGHEYFLGDNCVYTRPAGRMDMASEVHCTATSIWEVDRYTRSLVLPGDLGLYLPPTELLTCPTHFALVAPDALNADEIRKSSAAFSIEYELADDSKTANKFLRIPYLDQYPDAPTLIAPNRPWYHAWDQQEPLVVRGLSAYFSPKPIRDQVLEDVAVFAIDSNGVPVPGKRIALPNQRYVTGTTHLTLEPALQEGYFTVEPGEYLSGSARLVEGNKTADCALFVLVDIPAHKREGMTIGPLFRSHGVANLEYVRGRYLEDRRDNQPTPAGKAVLHGLLATDQLPWSELAADLPAGASEDEALDFATKMLFVD